MDTKLTRSIVTRNIPRLRAEYADSPELGEAVIARMLDNAIDDTPAGSPASPSRDKADAGAQAEATRIADREAAITKSAREYQEQNRLNGTPVTPEWAREHATAIVDLEAQFAQLNQPEPTVAEYEAQFKADAEDAEASRAAFDKLVAERPARDAARAAQELAVARVNAQRQALLATGMTSEQAVAAVPDAPAGPAMLEPSSLERASAALFHPEA